MTYKFIMHIGPGKTGSSSIQNALTMREDDLKKIGVLAPESLRSTSGDHHQLAELIQDVADRASELKTFVSDISQRMRTENFSTVIVSSDFFANLTLKPLQAFRDLLHAEEFDIEVIVYCRNLYRIALSTLQQQIQNGKHLENFYVYKPFTYFLPVKTYSDVFGQPNVQLRDYAADTDKTWSVVSDFFARSLPAEISDMNYPWVNRSITATKLQLINHFNYLFTYPSKPGHVRIPEMFRWVVHNMQEKGNGKLSLSSSEVKSLYEYFSYDRDLFESFLPELSPHKFGDLITAPEGILGQSFDELICRPPTADLITKFFAMLSSTTNEPDLAHALGIDKTA